MVWISSDNWGGILLDTSEKEEIKASSSSNIPELIDPHLQNSEHDMENEAKLDSIIEHENVMDNSISIKKDKIPKSSKYYKQSLSSIDERESDESGNETEILEKRKLSLDEILGEPNTEDGAEEEYFDSNQNTIAHDETDDLRAHWNLATYLPPAAAEYFYFIIGNLLLLL
jgi:hypothetical protein